MVSVLYDPVGLRPVGESICSLALSFRLKSGLYLAFPRFSSTSPLADGEDGDSFPDYELMHISAGAVHF